MMIPKKYKYDTKTWGVVKPKYWWAPWSSFARKYLRENSNGYKIEGLSGTTVSDSNLFYPLKDCWSFQRFTLWDENKYFEMKLTQNTAFTSPSFVIAYWTK